MLHNIKHKPERGGQASDLNSTRRTANSKHDLYATRIRTCDCYYHRSMKTIWSRWKSRQGILSRTGASSFGRRFVCTGHKTSQGRLGRKLSLTRAMIAPSHADKEQGDFQRLSGFRLVERHALLLTSVSSSTSHRFPTLVSISASSCQEGAHHSRYRHRLWS